MTRTMLLFAATLALAACDRADDERPAEAPAETPADTNAEAPAADTGAPTGKAVPMSPQDLFLQRIADHCGRAYEGRVVANEPAQDDDPFEGKTLVMHVRECSPDEIKIPFHVGDDHSRTWVITRVAAGVAGMEGLRLKHDHRHEDGTPHDITMYGGDTANGGTATRQEFPVDQESKDMFEAAKMNVSMANTWAMEIEPERFLYELSRPEGRLFQVEFDLTKPVAPPPAPWGHELVKVPDPEAG